MAHGLALSDAQPRVVQTPPAVRLLLGLAAAGFVIYIPVALFRTTLPLLAMDAVLILVFALTLGTGARRLYGGSAVIVMLVSLFVLSMLPSMLIDQPGSPASTLQGLRSVLFGMLAFLVASAWMDTGSRVDRYVRIMVFGGLFAAVYALRQIAFGLLPFELERLALMGGSGREAELLIRVRIPSAFGDPATFGFFGMLAIVLFFVAKRRGLLPAWLMRFDKLALLLLIVGVGSTLTRAPLLGLACAAIWLIVTSSRFGARWLAKMAIIAGVGFAGALTLNYVVTNNVLADSETPWVRSANNALVSAWTLVPIALSGEVTGRLNTLRSGSATERGDAWREGLAYLDIHPLGGGIGNMTEGAPDEIRFSPVDVGFLRFGLELGWLGMFAMVGLWLAVLGVGVLKWRRAPDARSRELGRGLIAAWIGIGAAQAVSSFLHTELIAAAAWTVAAMLLNLDRIANSEASRHLLQGAGERS